MNVRDYIAHETDRQSGTVQEAIGMWQAFNHFKNAWKNGWRLNEGFILDAAKMIHGNAFFEYRRVPAVFNQGLPAIPASQVPQAMKRLGETLNSREGEHMFDTPRENADYFTREFLLIHPFTDGNGRVGSLIWNYLNRTIENPEPMPYFFGGA